MPNPERHIREDGTFDLASYREERTQTSHLGNLEPLSIGGIMGVLDQLRLVKDYVVGVLTGRPHAKITAAPQEPKKWLFDGWNDDDEDLKDIPRLRTVVPMKSYEFFRVPTTRQKGKRCRVDQLDDRRIPSPFSPEIEDALRSGTMTVAEYEKMMRAAEREGTRRLRAVLRENQDRIRDVLYTQREKRGRKPRSTSKHSSSGTSN